MVYGYGRRDRKQKDEIRRSEAQPAIAADKIPVFKECGDGPGEGIEQEQGRDGLEISEHRKYPHYPEDTGAGEDNGHGNHAFAKTPAPGDGVIHQGGNTVYGAHNGQPLHARRDDGGVCGEEGKKLRAEGHQRKAQKSADAKGIAKADQVALADPLPISGAVEGAVGPKITS